MLVVLIGECDFPFQLRKSVYWASSTDCLHGLCCCWKWNLHYAPFHPLIRRRLVLDNIFHKNLTAVICCGSAGVCAWIRAEKLFFSPPAYSVSLSFWVLQMILYLNSGKLSRLLSRLKYNSIPAFESWLIRDRSYWLHTDSSRMPRI